MLTTKEQSNNIKKKAIMNITKRIETSLINRIDNLRIAITLNFLDKIFIPKDKPSR